MKKLLCTISFICVFFISFANNQPKVGDTLIVKAPSGKFYNHISFPQLNILVKRGKLASYSSVIHNKVLVDEVITKDNNKTYVVLKKENGTKFFGFLTSVKASYEAAIASGELVKTEY
ncbi:hypothetical protein Q4512_01670 [Oceanihabitans sp. 2_MG-2023]|uniref:hypothetical protein n=1 Tax=Oceanihabitans sp. 2_MG-2023 TaxID=3062661 RepID=UPI0026E224BD|nr:hypothetical protein [Oceanihabitans sp. 2_MG-2023]MDO6595601.1 hypothetical protein [Oceanihabitans sp. 2_MG-2023]